MAWIILAGLAGSGVGAALGFLVGLLSGLGDTGSESYWNTGDSPPVSVKGVVIGAVVGAGIAMALAAR